jgi:hypothetical protein
VQQQYLPPNDSSRRLLSSYARHVCLAQHPTHPEWKVKSVKIYRVVHMIPAVGAFVIERVDPRDPENYRPYYMGEYDPAGHLLDINIYDVNRNIIKRGDPFLFWLLPMLRDQPSQVRSPVKGWVHKHAGDPDWIYQYDEREKRHLLVREPEN